MVEPLLELAVRAAIKGGAGSGNWGHGGLPGQWGGSSPEGPSSEAFLAHPGSLRHSFDPDTGEFNEQRHLNHVSDLEAEDYSEYMEELEKYTSADEEYIQEQIDAGEIDEDAEIEEIDTDSLEKYSSEELQEKAAQARDLVVEARDEHGEEGGRAERVNNLVERLHGSYTFEEAALRSQQYKMKDAFVQAGFGVGMSSSEVQEWLSHAGVSSQRAIISEYPGGEEAYDQLLREAEQRTISGWLDEWEMTSGDHNPEMVMLQQQAVEEFGLDDAVLDHIPDDVLKSADEEIPFMVKDGAKEFLRAIYDETQERLEAEGIDTIVLYRGMEFDEIPPEMMHIDFTPGTVVKDSLDIEMQPLSSFSAEPGIAKSFARGEYNLLLATEVQREDVLSTSSTGFGVFDESEYTVIGEQARTEVLAGTGSDWAPTQQNVYSMFAGEDS